MTRARVRFARVIGVLAVAGITLIAGEARATSCREYISETLQLSLIEVERDGVVAEAPLRLDAIDEAVNSIEDGLLVWDGLDGDLDDLRKFYILDEAITPTAAVQAELDEANGRARRSAKCGRVPYRAIPPGVYVFSANREDLSKESSVIGEPVVTVAADRNTVTLGFGFENANWVALYNVDEACFRCSGCGCSSSPDPGEAGLLSLLVLAGLRRRRQRRS